MLLGKRPRPPMKRTTSMTKSTCDLNICSEAQPSDALNPFSTCQSENPVVGYGVGGGDTQKQGGDHQGLDQRLLATVSPRGNHKRHSADYVETPHFLRSCSLCKRSLVPGRDIYMYRGDSAFCSSECRQQQMNQDERKKKCGLSSKKEAVASGTKGETVAAL